MTDQQPQNQLTIEEITTKLITPYGAALVNNLGLEKQIAAQAQAIQGLTENEASLIDHIANLEEELAELKTNLETLEAQLVDVSVREALLLEEVKVLEVVADNEAAFVASNAITEPVKMFTPEVRVDPVYHDISDNENKPCREGAEEATPADT